ncbi:hypothetical protein DFH09DRAFT_1069077 [Mycena vulgaris]|nr:hypothetical protein DFH09DRAFT_1069077 [Mycena vulgaris]
MADRMRRTPKDQNWLEGACQCTEESPGNKPPSRDRGQHYKDTRTTTNISRRRRRGVAAGRHSKQVHRISWWRDPEPRGGVDARYYGPKLTYDTIIRRIEMRRFSPSAPVQIWIIPASRRVNAACPKASEFTWHSDAGRRR